MTQSRESITVTAISIVADALGHSPADVKIHSSLIDDLGAESIDFLDIVFRLESSFGIKISGDEMWRGAFSGSGTSDAAIDDAIRSLRERLPEFRWDRYPNGPTRNDLPRLVSVNTIVDYLERRLSSPEGTPAG